MKWVILPRTSHLMTHSKDPLIMTKICGVCVSMLRYKICGQDLGQSVPNSLCPPIPTSPYLNWFGETSLPAPHLKMTVAPPPPAPGSSPATRRTSDWCTREGFGVFQTFSDWEARPRTTIGRELVSIIQSPSIKWYNKVSINSPRI